VAVCGFAAIVLLCSPIRVPEGRGGELALFAVALLLFGVPLSGMWSGGPDGVNVMVGVFPYSDAAGYEQGGRVLLEDGQLDAWNSRRPLTAVLVGGLLTASHGSLQLTQAILVYLNAVAAFCAARAL
jgi:hypothetical protein